MNISQGIVLNLSAGGIPPRLRMVQGDSNTRTIEASLWDGAQPYAVPDGSSVMVRFRKPDGTGGLYDTTEGGSPITFDGNNVAAPVATQMLAVPGEVAAEMDIYGTGTGTAAEKLATFRFIVEVAPCVLPDAEIISSDYYNILSAQIAAAVAAGEKADAALAAANQAAAAAESAEQSKTAAAGSAASASRDAQTAASAKTDAVAAKAAAESAQEAAQASQTAAAGSASSAAENAQSAAQDAQDAAQDAEDAEAWAVGKRNGVDVPPSDPAYLNNAKYYKDQAQGIAGGEYVSYGTPQQLADAQKQQARENIGAAAPYAPGQNIAISNNTIGTKAFPCNPNLLDNWYFGNPVNQRGQTSWNGSEEYTIDRWATERYRTGTKSITLDSGAITITNNDNSADAYIGIQEKIEFDLPIGTPVTLSVLTGSGLKVFSTVIVSNSVRAKDFENFTLYLYQTGSESRRTVAMRVYSGKSEAFYAVKLELGTEQTLAHQDANGNWVLNEMPDYGEQLRRCQRYYQTFPENLTVMLGNSGSSTGTDARLVLPCQPMRTNPVAPTFTVATWGYASDARTFTPSSVFTIAEGLAFYGNISPAIDTVSGTYAPIIAQLRGSSLSVSADL